MTARTKTSHCLMAPVFRSGVTVLNPRLVYKIGRTPENEVALPHAHVSRLHAEIRWTNEAFAVVDCGSQNGTFVNAQRIEGEKALADKDKLAVGPFELTYRRFEGDFGAMIRNVPGGAEETVRVQSGSLGAPAANLGGRFTGVEIVEICQFIAFNQKDGVLRIDGAATSGEIEFAFGNIVRAEAPGSAGEAAARQLLRLPEGAFVFQSAAAKVRVIQPLLQTLPFLMDLCRAEDEGGAAAPHDQHAETMPMRQVDGKG